MIEEIEKDLIKDSVKAKTLIHISEFYRCRSCGKVYWKGSHYDKMQGLIREFGNLEIR
jgi:hypothetical protein